MATHSTLDRFATRPAVAWDNAIDALLCVLLVFAPFAYGTTEPWSRQIALGLIALTAICSTARQFTTGHPRPSWSWSYLPIIAFVAFAIFQIVPLPRVLVSAISPNTVAIRNDLLNDLGGTAPYTTLSLYTHATLADLRVLLGVAVLFVVVLQRYRTKADIKRLLAIVSIAGAPIVVLALYQNLSGTRLIYGQVPMGHPNSGPFMNHSHFGQFVNLSIGCALALIFMKMRENKAQYGDALGRGARNVETTFLPLALLMAFVVFGAVAIFLSLTRAGMASMLIAGSLTALVTTWRLGSSSKATTLVLLGAAVLSILLFFGFDAVYDRLATFRDLDTAQGDRAQLLRDASSAWAQYPLTGTGLGTHQFVFPMYDRTGSLALATHAENEYAQLMLETGALGLLPILAFLAMAATAYTIALRSPRRTHRVAAAGLGYGLIAVLLHSFTDFGQHIPAVAFLSAITIALLLNLARLAKAVPSATSTQPHDQLTTIDPTSPTGLFKRLAFAITIITASTWATWSVNAARLADRERSTVAFLENQRGTRDAHPNLNQRIMEGLERLLRHDSQDVRAHYKLAFYRYQALLDNLNTHDSLRGEHREQAMSILNDLATARRLAPTYGPPYSLAGEITFFDLHDPTGEPLIRTGYKLTPQDPYTSFSMGYLAILDGDTKLALTTFNHAVSLDGNLRNPVLSILATNLERPDLAFDFAMGNRIALLRLATLLRDTPEHAELRDRCHAESFRILQAQAQQQNAPGHVLVEYAAHLEREGNFEQAIDCYRKALSRNFGETRWRLQLARTLAAAGRPVEAVDEARLCLKLRPELESARRLIAEQSVLQ